MKLKISKYLIMMREDVYYDIDQRLKALEQRNQQSRPAQEGCTHWYRDGVCIGCGITKDQPAQEKELWGKDPKNEQDYKELVTQNALTLQKIKDDQEVCECGHNKNVHTWHNSTRCSLCDDRDLCSKFKPKDQAQPEIDELIEEIWNEARRYYAGFVHKPIPSHDKFGQFLKSKLKEHK